MKHLASVSAQLETSTRAREFVALARVVALAKGGQAAARAIANEAGLSPAIKTIFAGPKVTDLVHRQKAAVLAGSTGDSTWAGPLASYDVLASAFLESLRNFGAFDRMLPSMRRVPFRVRVGANTFAASGTVVGPGSMKPISKLTLAGTQIDEAKALCILVVTSDLARFGDRRAGDLFGIELQAGVAVATDETFISILSSGAPSIPSSGATAEGVRNDLRIALLSVTTNARSQLFLLMPSAVAKVLAVMHTTAGDAAFPDMTVNGGTIGGMVAVVSDGVPAATIVLADAQQIAAASDTVQLDAAAEAIVQMDTAPDSPPTASTNMISLWQHDLLGLKAERFFGAQKLTTTGVAVITGINYTGDSPGP
jgi:hypothetical protein